MSFTLKLEPIREVYSKEDYRTIACMPHGFYKDLELNKYHNFTLSGTNLDMLEIGVEYDLEIEKAISKYEASYILIGWNQTGEDNSIKITPEQEVAILRRIAEGNQPEHIHSAYPNFVQMILDGKESEIDINNIKNVGKQRFALYIDKIRDSFNFIKYLPIMQKWGVTSQSDVDGLIKKFEQPERLEEALDNNPYHVFFDLMNYPFVKSDKYVLNHKPEYTKSIERAEFACLEILRQNELEGDTKIDNELLEILAEELAPEVVDLIPQAIEQSERIIRVDDYMANRGTYQAEVNIASNIKERLSEPNFFDGEVPDFEPYRSIDGVTCTDEQMRTLKNIWNKNVSMLSGGAGCVDCDTEFFNGHGWKRIADYTEGEDVLQYNENGTAELVRPLAYIKEPCGYLWHFETPRNINQTVCENHRILYKQNQKSKIQETDILNLKEKSDSNIHWNGKFITQFYRYGDGITLTDAEIRVMIAVMAEGHFDTKWKGSKTKWCRIRLKKERKITRLRYLLNQANIEYKEQIDKFGVTIIRFYAPERRKIYGDEWWNVNKHQARIIYEEVTKWDGTIIKSRINKKEKPCFRTTEKQSADYIQYIFTINGWQSTISSNKNAPSRKENSKIVYRVSTKLNPLSSLCFDTRKRVKKTQFVRTRTKDNYKYCFTVPSHMLVLRRKDCIFITGNCGKTSGAKAVIKMLENNNIDCLLLAPTGIAVKKLKESTGRVASTVHMFLASGGNKDFNGVVIIDEASLCGVHLLSTLFNSVGSKSKFLFICDEAQLASISCGNVVQDIIDSGVMPTARLTKVFRYGTSGLATIATDTRNGELGPRVNSNFSDYRFIPISSKPIRQILDVYEELLDKYHKNDIMILSPYNKGNAGTVAINNAIQSRFNQNPDTNAIRKILTGEIMFKVGDKVINTHNEYNMPCCELNEYGEWDYSRNTIPVMNGDIGYVRQIKDKGNNKIEMLVEFDTGMARIYGPYMNNLLLGYAISIHKSQGSEAKAVIVITSPMHKRMLSSNLLYVADSRAKEQLIEIGDIETIKEGLKRHENKERDTWLKELLLNR